VGVAWFDFGHGRRRPTGRNRDSHPAIGSAPTGRTGAKLCPLQRRVASVVTRSRTKPHVHFLVGFLAVLTFQASKATYACDLPCLAAAIGPSRCSSIHRRDWLFSWPLRPASNAPEKKVLRHPPYHSCDKHTRSERPRQPRIMSPADKATSSEQPAFPPEMDPAERCVNPSSKVALANKNGRVVY
jgi:hypothetical protein